MPCFNPIALKHNNPLLLNSGRVVPCGSCIGCLKMRRDAWSIRLKEELKVSEKATFLTLTYNDEHLPKSGQLNKKDLQNYFKRVRSEEKKLKYYACGEYGEDNNRPHYHGIIFNVDKEILINKWSVPTGQYDYEGRPINEEMGFVECDPVNEATIHYVTKYITNGKKYSYGYIKPFAIMSKGLGKSFINTNSSYHKSLKSTTYVGLGGVKNNLPRYYRDRIFSDMEKEEINKLSRQKRNEEILKEDARKRVSRKKAIINVTTNKSKSKKL